MDGSQAGVRQKRPCWEGAAISRCLTPHQVRARAWARAAVRWLVGRLRLDGLPAALAEAILARSQLSNASSQRGRW